MPIRWFQHCLCVLLVGLLSIGGLAAGPVVNAATHLEDRIVAVVNAELIMLSEVQRELAPELERLRTHYKGDELAQRIKLAEYMALTRMIERRLQLQEAKTKGIDVSEQEIRQTLQQMKQQGERVDERDPATQGNIRDQLMLLRVVDREVRSGIMVGDAEVKRYYTEHQDRFALPEEYTLSQILIQPRAPDRTAEALEKAQLALAELKRGRAFEDVALRLSDGPNASQGGRLGLVRQGELTPAIERAIAPLPPGAITGVVETSEGFHIVRVDGRTPKQFRPFDEVKFEIQGLVFQQKSEDFFQSWLVNLKNKAYIEIKF